jgi:hypothetical protein
MGLSAVDLIVGGVIAALILIVSFTLWLAGRRN